MSSANMLAKQVQAVCHPAELLACFLDQCPFIEDMSAQSDYAAYQAQLTNTREAT